MIHKDRAGKALKHILLGAKPKENQAETAPRDTAQQAELQAIISKVSLMFDGLLGCVLGNFAW